MGSNKGMFEECWTPIHNRDPGDETDPNIEPGCCGQCGPRGCGDIEPFDDEQVEGHRVYGSSIALEANDIVAERGEFYGPPSENHSCTAHMWNAYLRRRFDGTSFRLDAEDVCWLNVLQKISRQAHVRKRDNKVDVIGFVINSDMLD